MKHLLTTHHPIRHAKSFKYAFKGIFHALAHEANFRVQVVIVIVTTSLGLYYRIGNLEWAMLILCMGLLLSAEMINTVVEEVIDHLIKEYHEGARVIKDLSAGFVLITAITTLMIIFLIFGHRIFG